MSLADELKEKSGFTLMEVALRFRACRVVDGAAAAKARHAYDAQNASTGRERK